MSYEHKEGYGALFKDNKKGSDKAPDYRGNIMVAGVVYELAGWIKTGAKGNFLSLKAQPQGDRQEAPRKSAPKDDSIPF